MIVVATLLIALGLVVSLLGLKLFRILLPIIGLVTGAMAGFIGIQAIFGSGVASLAVAIVVAVVVGVLLAILSYVLFDIAAIVYIALLGGTALSYVGVALGLNQDGFLVLVLGICGAIIGGVLAAQNAWTVKLVVILSALLGVAYILSGVMLLAGDVGINELNDRGVVPTIIDVVDQSFVWFFVWVGGALLAIQAQYAILRNPRLDDTFEYKVTNKSN